MIDENSIKRPLKKRWWVFNAELRANGLLEKLEGRLISTEGKTFIFSGGHSQDDDQLKTQTKL